ncbi:hypothetical protein E2K80_18535 [Rhodophyticola sp. CCM32]|uniref:hypothetical protein n=1 Tax=Rhodophyticola sp. CCM32 TaxID=2916397 RepID=UPI00107F0A3F|nr:hypothetical protein [Rhodophyticola sp. CCM32]QBY02486.1 hypothetical protein E2K80_18535 [Rhodophyticola sp. CCM32]
MPEIILHIGAHKTGTTSLQRLCAENRALMERNNVLYPDTNWYHYAQHRLAFALRGQNRGGADATQELGAFARAIASTGAQKIFVSSEELFSIPLEKLRPLATCLKNRPVKIIAVLRRPDEFLLSLYNQKVKHPGNAFRQPIGYFLKNPGDIDADIHFRACIGNWSSLFGRENITLLNYDSAPPVESVLEILGLTGKLHPPPHRENTSVPGAVAEIMRLSKMIEMPTHRQKQLYTLALGCFSNRPRLHVSAEDRRAIVARFEPENDALFAEFGQENPYRAARLRFAEDGAKDAPALNLRDMMDLVNHLFEDMA